MVLLNLLLRHPIVSQLQSLSEQTISIGRDAELGEQLPLPVFSRTSPPKMDPEKAPTPEAGSGDDSYKHRDTHIEELRREQTHVDIDPAAHSKLNRKFDLHVIPFLFGIWYDLHISQIWAVLIDHVFV